MFRALRQAALAAPFILAACDGASSDAPTGDAKTETPADGAAQPTAENSGDDVVIAASDMVLGDENAPVTIIEYASVTCPGCAAFHAGMLPELKEKYIDTGKAKFVFREFPTPPVEFSYIGSLLARCAADKSGKDSYFLIIDALFKNQRQWIYGDDPKLELTKIASQVGMDEAQFDACLQRQELIDAMNERIEEARTKYNVSSTPSFVINGEPTRIGSLEDFTKILDEALGEDAPAPEETGENPQ